MDDEDQDPILDRPYKFRVDGECVIYPWQEEADQNSYLIEAAAEVLGLHAFRLPFGKGQDPDQVVTTRRWAQRRVTLDEIHRVIAGRPGIKFADLLERLYAGTTSPWTDRERRHAAGKLRTSLSRLRSDGKVLKKFDHDGKECWETVGAEKSLLVAKYGRAAPVAAQLAAGANILSPIVSSHGDPNLLEDLARAVYNAMNEALPPETEETV